MKQNEGCWPEEAPARGQQREGNGLLLSAVSLGLVTAGVVFVPPLQYGCIPVITYLSVCAAKDAYQAMVREGRFDIAAAESAILGLTLVQGNYLFGSLTAVLYYGGRKVWHTMQRSTHSAAKTGMPLTANLLRADGKEVEVPIHTLHCGDTVLICAGEIIPVDGVILSGSAWIVPQTEAHNAAFVIKRAGSYVHATDLVLAGSVRVVMQPPPV
jgi:cation transport ATPase